MTNYQQKQELERWTCKCGIPRKLKKKNKPCETCGELPSNKSIFMAKKSQMTRHI